MINFQKIKITKLYFVVFTNKGKDSSEYTFFMSTKAGMEVAEENAWGNMMKLGLNPSEYKMSTRREIRISIIF